ncbi:YchJ family protein [Kribbia dieselivorans]|uniref:YchJ family protein n=1 Tax=Kribbia dieselivorans TaxID=331526 RepID=UPI00083979E0|nr:YchJ family metal-binding protein [Kribbia dieselivorans]
MSHPTDPCPCGSGATLEQCCGPIIDGTRAAATAEELMRSRYSAFAVLRTDPGAHAHLLRSHHPRTRPESVRAVPGLEWSGLEVVETTGGHMGDETGTVTFRAHWRATIDGRTGVQTEQSRFERRGGRWVYTDGDVTEG